MSDILRLPKNGVHRTEIVAKPEQVPQLIQTHLPIAASDQMVATIQTFIKKGQKVTWREDLHIIEEW